MIFFNYIRKIKMELDFKKIEKYNQAYQKWLKTVPKQAYEYDNEVCCCFAHLLSNEAEKDGYQRRRKKKGRIQDAGCQKVEIEYRVQILFIHSRLSGQSSRKPAVHQ